MTTQIEDTLLLEGDSYTLIGCSGGDLLHPRQFRMDPAMLHTACLRGWYCAFEVDGMHLVLRALTLREAQDRYLPIDGIAPRIDRRARSASYEGLSTRVGYSGRLRIGLGLDGAQARRIGMRQSHRYHRVLDVDFLDGGLEQIIDRSDVLSAGPSRPMAAGHAGR